MNRTGFTNKIINFKNKNSPNGDYIPNMVKGRPPVSLGLFLRLRADRKRNI